MGTVAMGSSQSTEKKSPAKEIHPKESPLVTDSSIKDSPVKEETPVVSSNDTDVKSSSAKEECSEAGDSLPNIAGLAISSVTPTKASASVAGDEATTPNGDNNVSEEDLALVEAVSKTLRDTTGGKSLEIVLSPAVKKPKSRVSPPTSPTNSQETIAKKLQEAEERKHVLKLGKIPNVQEMKEKKVAEKSELVKEKLESKLNH